MESEDEKMDDAEESDDEPAEKKIKQDAGPLTFAFTDLPDNLTDEKITAWLQKQIKGLEVISMRANWRRNKAFIDISGNMKEKVLALAGTSFNGSDIHIEVDERNNAYDGKPRTGQTQDFRTDARKGEKDARTLFVRGIPYSADEDGLWALPVFEKATAVRITRDKETGDSRGFGFIEFENEGDADAAFEMRRDAQLDGRNLFFDFCGEKSQKDKDGGRGRGRGGFGGDRGGRGGGRGRGGFGDSRGRGRGGFGGDRGGRGRGRGAPSFAAQANRGSIQEFQGTKKTFNDSD